MQEEQHTKIEDSEFSRQSELTLPENRLLNTYAELLRVLQIMEECTALQSQNPVHYDEAQYLDPFSVDSLNSISLQVNSATEQAGNILNSTFGEIKSIHQQVRKFIENLEEKWTEKSLLEWTEQKLTADVTGTVQAPHSIS